MLSSALCPIDPQHPNSVRNQAEHAIRVRNLIPAKLPDGGAFCGEPVRLFAFSLNYSLNLRHNGSVDIDGFGHRADGYDE